MSGPNDEGADEIKVFQSNDVDDGESAQPVQQLTEDKKEVAYQTELETHTSTPSTSSASNGSSIGSKVGAFSKPQGIVSEGFSPGGSSYTIPHLWMSANGLNFHQQSLLWSQVHGQPYSLPLHPPPPLFSGHRLPLPVPPSTYSFGSVPPPPAHNGSSSSSGVGVFGTLSLDPNSIAIKNANSPTFPTSPYYPYMAGVSPTFPDMYSRAFMMGQSVANLSPMHSPSMMTNQSLKQAQAELLHLSKTNSSSHGSLVMPLASSLQNHIIRMASNPLTSINQMRLQTMPTPITSMANNLATQRANAKNGVSDSRANRQIGAGRKPKDSHIKKPLNAFMWFMKQNRPKLMEEQNYKERQSAELNKELGRRWHDLSPEEQQKYYAIAREEQTKHRAKYPEWTARDNYAINRKKKRKRDKSSDNSELKKCRARYGLDNQNRWCKHCKRKKRCLWYREGKLSADEHSPLAQVTSTTHGSPGVTADNHREAVSVGHSPSSTSTTTTNGTASVSSSTANRRPPGDDDSDDDENDNDDEEDTLTVSSLPVVVIVNEPS